jgi:hypothetical protein
VGQLDSYRPIFFGETSTKVHRPQFARLVEVPVFHFSLHSARFFIATFVIHKVRLGANVMQVGSPLGSSRLTETRRTYWVPSPPCDSVVLKSGDCAVEDWR